MCIGWYLPRCRGPELCGVCMPARLEGVFSFPLSCQVELINGNRDYDVGGVEPRKLKRKHIMEETSGPTWKAPHQTSRSCFSLWIAEISMGGRLQMNAWSVKRSSQRRLLWSVEGMLGLNWWEHVMLGQKKGGGSWAKEIQCNNYLTKALIRRCHQTAAYASSLLGAVIARVF